MGNGNHNNRKFLWISNVRGLDPGERIILRYMMERADADGYIVNPGMLANTLGDACEMTKRHAWRIVHQLQYHKGFIAGRKHNIGKYGNVATSYRLNFDRVFPDPAIQVCKAGRAGSDGCKTFRKPHPVHSAPFLWEQIIEAFNAQLVLPSAMPTHKFGELQQPKQMTCWYNLRLRSLVVWCDSNNLRAWLDSKATLDKLLRIIRGEKLPINRLEFLNLP